MMNQAILCVDDERILLLSLRDQIIKSLDKHYRYEFAETVDEAWEAIDELARDQINILIMLSDWLMPGMRGNEFLARIQQKFSKIITALLSGQVDSRTVANARQSVLYVDFAKPWAEARLISTIRSGLEQAHE